MDEAGLGADVLGHGGEKGDDVVLHLGFDGVDAGDVELPLFADHRHRFLGNHPQLGLTLAGQGFYLQPDPKTVLRLPDPGHFLAGVTFDHG